MNERKIRYFVILMAVLFLLAGTVLFLIFDKQGMGKNRNNNYVNYNVNDYVDTMSVVFSNYENVYSNISVSKILFKNIDDELTKDFMYKQNEVINYITGYYNEISSSGSFEPINTVSSNIKTQVNGAVLSVFYQLDFILDKNVFSDNIKSYIITMNVDLRTNKVLTNDDLLSKYDYSRNYIADKLFNEDVLIDKGQIVIDKNTNISLTRNDIERKKSEYVNRIILEFDNIIVMYIENNSLVLVYDTDDLRSVFFDNEFDTDIKFRYLK